MYNNPPPPLISETKTGSYQVRLKFPAKKWWGDNQSGVTLVEVLVSLFLFGIALGSLMFILSTVLTSADDLRNNTIAAGLAPEGLEVVRNIRDQNWFNGPSFFTGIADGNYEVQWDSISLTNDASRYLKKDLTTGIFSYSSANSTDTRFKRTITITTISSSEKRVTVLVSWQGNGGISKILSAESHLFDWYQP